MEISRLQNNVERWLVHESYKFSNLKNDANHFTIAIKQTGSTMDGVEIFCPRQQNTVLVIGASIFLKNNQNSRYLKLNDTQKKNFEKRIEDYCYSIKAIGNIQHTDGKLAVGAYIVLDDESSFNQHDFADALDQVSEMGDKIDRFLLKTF